MTLARNQLHMVNLDRGDHYRNSYPKGFGPMTIPEGSSGSWEVRRFTVTEDNIGLYNLRLIRDGQWRRILPPGTYTKLVHSGEGVVMSDTPAEAHEHTNLLHEARGCVLLNGLGLGFALSAILRKPEVEWITVIEQSQDVIKLVGSHFSDERLQIICDDALTWRPSKGRLYDVVWHDIWTTICDDNKPQMTKLRRAYGKRCRWQGCWSQEYL